MSIGVMASRVWPLPIVFPHRVNSLKGWHCNCSKGDVVIHKHEAWPGSYRQKVNVDSDSRIPPEYLRLGLKTPAFRCFAMRKSLVSTASGVTESGLFTLSDSELGSRGLELHSSNELLDLDQLNTLFVKVGFPRRQKEKLSRALDHTLSLVWIRNTKSEHLIAFARATGDNVFNAIIWDVVVDPSYQGLGLGKVVMERLMADLVKKGISNIALYAEPNVVGFYKPLGFISDPDGIRAMAYSRRRR